MGGGASKSKATENSRYQNKRSSSTASSTSKTGKQKRRNSVAQKSTPKIPKNTSQSSHKSQKSAPKLHSSKSFCTYDALTEEYKMQGTSKLFNKFDKLKPAAEDLERNLQNGLDLSEAGEMGDDEVIDMSEQARRKSQKRKRCMSQKEEQRRMLRSVQSDTDMDQVTKLIWELEDQYKEKVEAAKKNHQEARKQRNLNNANKVPIVGDTRSLITQSYVSSLDCMTITAEDSTNEQFNATTDAEHIKKCLKRKHFTDLINLVSKRSCVQRCTIASRYKSLFGLSIFQSFRSDLVGDFRVLMEGLFVPVIDYLTTCLRRSMKGFGTDEQVLIDILVPCCNDDIKMLKDCYNKKYNRDLEKDLSKETSGHFKRIMVSLIQGERIGLGIDFLKG